MLELDDGIDYEASRVSHPVCMYRWTPTTSLMNYLHLHSLHISRSVSLDSNNQSCSELSTS